MKFSGRLADFSLPDVLRILVQSHKVGSLVLQVKDEQGRIYVNQGELHHAVCAGLEGDRAMYHLLTVNPDTEFEFVESSSLPAKTLESDLDTLIQNGIDYLEHWRKVAKNFPQLSTGAKLIFKNELEGLEDPEKEVLTLISQEQEMVLSHLGEKLEWDPMVLGKTLDSLEKAGCIQVIGEEKLEFKRFFIEMANTMYSEFESISGMKLKQETLVRLETLIEENNWKIDLQNGRIVGEKIRIDTMDEQKSIFGQYLRHLIEMIVPIYGSDFVHQVVEKVEKRLTGPIHHWVEELNLKV